MTIGLSWIGYDEFVSARAKTSYYMRPSTIQDFATGHRRRGRWADDTSPPDRWRSGDMRAPQLEMTGALLSAGERFMEHVDALQRAIAEGRLCLKCDE
jgi:hypothetical protein